jgi:hypothetical protein
MAKRMKAPKPGMTKQQRWRVVNVVMYAVTAVAGAAMLYSVVVLKTPRPSRQPNRLLDQQATQATAAAPTCPQRSGQDWEYDAATNCYFDPSPGHRHWHSGRPPDEAERAQRMAQPAATPIPAQPAPTSP